MAAASLPPFFSYNRDPPPPPLTRNFLLPSINKYNTRTPPPFVHRTRASSPKESATNSTSNPNAATMFSKTKYSFNWVGDLFQGLRADEFIGDGLVLEILSIALPAALALTADPLTSLVDTAFIGHLGSAELAGVGVSISVFNLVSKLFNIPLLNITTSFVAEEEVLIKDANKEDVVSSSDAATTPKKYLPSVSASLALAVAIGLVEALALSVGSGFFLNIMGIPADSPMHAPATQFLSVRAFGAPAVVIALAAQGAFRGFKDMKTPLYAIGVGNLLNAVLDPILMFVLQLGVGGAAAATVLSEYVIAFILLLKLDSKVALSPLNIDSWSFTRYLKSGTLLTWRTIAVLTTLTLGTSLAARQGAIPMAGHQICLQVWLAVSLLNDSLALSGQALIASAYTQEDYKKTRMVIYRVLQIGLSTGLALAVILYFGFGSFSRLFSTDASVVEIASSGVLFVAGSQPMNALAFVFDGVYYGVSDFTYAAYSMVLVGIVSSLFLLLVAPNFGLAGVWSGLFLFMSLRAAAGFWRLSVRDGPWKMIWEEVEVEMIED